MAYVHEVSFDLAPQQVEQLVIGEAVERVLGYLRVLLPSQPGYITARSMFSLDRSDVIHVLFQSIWETWEELQNHVDSQLAENQVLEEFQPHVELQNVEVHLYQEVD